MIEVKLILFQIGIICSVLNFWNQPSSRCMETLVQSLNSPFFPPHIGAEPGRAKEESWDNLHAHAQNEPIKNYQVPTTLLASMCSAMPFSARALKENIFFDVDIVIKSIKT